MELLVFPKENHTFRDPKGSQVEAYVEVYVGAKLELILGPRLELCWEVFGGQVGAKTPPRCSKTRPRRAKTRQDAPKTRQDAPKTRKDAPRRLQDAPKTPQGRAKTRPRRAKTSQDARRCSQDASKTVFCSILMDLGSIFDGLYTLKRVLVSRCRLYKHIVKLMKTH